jgi:Domain of unknown function (DUF1338)
LRIHDCSRERPPEAKLLGVNLSLSGNLWEDSRRRDSIFGLRLFWQGVDKMGNDLNGREKTLDVVLAGLMRRYSERVPDVGRVIECMVRDGVIHHASEIENDHIAFRSMAVPQLGIASLEKIFLALGYQRRDPYFFEAKKLNAFWYAPPSPRHPRIFISELRVNDLTPEARRIITSYTDEVTVDPVTKLDLTDGIAIDDFLHRSLWRTPTLSDYLRLAEESEYAAWVIYNRYYLNHFTVSVHNLPEGYSTIAQFNQFLERNHFKLNNSGGKAKTSDDGLLIQSSTVAEMVDAQFSDGHGGYFTHRISGSYVEFAERRVLPQFASLPVASITRQHRRDGFEANNADKIFESTFSTQTSR